MHGLIILRESRDFVLLNLDPVLVAIKTKLKVWSILPLSLIGRINPLKMKVLPKFTYIFRNSPQWLTKTFINSLKQLFLSFIWGPKPPRFKYTTLTRPVDSGGLALPDCHKYFLATQLVTTHWWLQPDLTNSAVVLEAAIVGSLEALKGLLFRGPKTPYHLTPSMRTTMRTWKVGEALRAPQPNSWSPHTPLWLNPNLSQFNTILDTQAWAKYKILNLEDVITNRELTPFHVLRTPFNVPARAHFRYL